MRSRSRYSAISLVSESERERTGMDADTDVHTLLYRSSSVVRLGNYDAYWSAFNIQMKGDVVIFGTQTRSQFTCTAERCH